jgi:hypothetical protein
MKDGFDSRTGYHSPLSENELQSGQMKTGTAVVFVDKFGVEHDALVTRSWGQMIPVTVLIDGKEEDIMQYPSINLVYVTKGDDTDQYGNQLRRETSIVHALNQAAHGNYWKEVG